MFKYLRPNLGPEVKLLHDVHERLTPIQAARVSKDLEPYRLFFLEDPIRPEHKKSLKVVRDASVTLLAIGKLYSSLWECEPVITAQLKAVT